MVLYGVKHYFWDDPFLFRECADGLFRRCVPGWEVYGVLTRCHNSPYGGHHGPTKTVAKIKESGFYWPTMFKDSHSLFKLVTLAKGLETSRGGMRCLKLVF